MNFADRDGVIWLDGEWIPWRDAKIHVLTHTLHYGLGVYEGIRAYKSENGSAIFRLDDHMQRLHNSAKLLQMDMPYSKEELKQAAIKAIKDNKLSSAYIRPMCFYGSEGMGLRADKLQTHVMIACWEWGAYLGDDGITKGIRIMTSTFRRIHINSSFTQAKANGHYVNSMLALREAQQAGFDEAMMLDHSGYLAEGSGENFFMVKDGIVYTPRPTCILAGLTRDTVMTLCRDQGYRVVECDITRDQAYLADELFFTGTAAEVTPIREFDRRVIADGTPGPVTKQIQQHYFDVVQAKQQQYQQWITLVEE